MQVFNQIENKIIPFDFVGDFICHVRFLAKGGKHTCLLSETSSHGGELDHIHIYLDGVKKRGVYIKKSANRKFVLTEIINGVAEEYGFQDVGSIL